MFVGPAFGTSGYSLFIFNRRAVGVRSWYECVVRRSNPAEYVVVVDVGSFWFSSGIGQPRCTAVHERCTDLALVTGEARLGTT